MKIESSTIEMNASRYYEKTEMKTILSDTMREEPKGKNAQATVSNQSFPPNGRSYAAESRLNASKMMAQMAQSQPAAQNISALNAENLLTDAANSDILILKLLMSTWERTEGKYSSTGGNSSSFSYYNAKGSVFSLSAAFQSGTAIAANGGGRAPGVWVREVKASSFQAEVENTTFSTAGVVKAADGKQFNFNLDVEMSRSFMKYTNLEYSEKVIFTDPLVINLQGNAANFSDKKFFFDIDEDGKEESISYLSKDSGYLALDRNNDGKINDGSELFGAKSGDGFGELSVYDQDHNGWIDENDEIFNQLKVWIKSDDGSDKLLDLKAAGIGAIYLGRVSTDFTLKSEDQKHTNGKIRQTGFYLHENGMSGTIQHVDVSV